MKLLKKLKLLKYRNNPYFEKFYKEVSFSKLEDITFCSFDLETTGLDTKKDEILSIGAVLIKNLRIDLSKSFYKVVKPHKKPEKENILIHGITQSELENAPPIEEILPQFLEFIKGTVLIGYFVKFDIDMLSKYTQKLYGFPVLNPYIDLRELYMKILHKSYTPAEKIQEKNLEELAAQFNIPVEKRHNAYYDSLISALIFLAIVKKRPSFIEKIIKKHI